MCPKRARHIFITDRLKNPHVPGPDNEAAALAMGNTVEQWVRTYYPQVAHDKVGWHPNSATSQPASNPASPAISLCTCSSPDLYQTQCFVLCR